MFPVIPFYETLFLQPLPVEVWCYILRHLDPRSLLAGARAYRLWFNVCQGDPVLKQRLRVAWEEERRAYRNMILDPRMSIRISREGGLGQYASNVKKIFSKSSEQCPRLNEDIGSSTDKAKVVKKRKHCGRRFAPYRI